MGNGTFYPTHTRTRTKVRVRNMGPNVRLVRQEERAVLAQLMAEKLGVARQGGTPLHDWLEEQEDIQNG